MSQYSLQNVAVPFETIGNRQVLTDQQLFDLPWLQDFIDRFPRCFERNDVDYLYVFHPHGRDM